MYVSLSVYGLNMKGTADISKEFCGEKVTRLPKCFNTNLLAALL